MIRMLQLHWKKIIITTVFLLLLSWLSKAEERLDDKFQEAVRKERQKKIPEKRLIPENTNFGESAISSKQGSKSFCKHCLNWPIANQT